MQTGQPQVAEVQTVQPQIAEAQEAQTVEVVDSLNNHSYHNQLADMAVE